MQFRAARLFKQTRHPTPIRIPITLSHVLDSIITLPFHSNYPEKRRLADSEGIEEGVVGSLKLLQNNTLSSQPVSSLDWSPDKLGLGVCTSFDQCVRVILTTKLNLY